MLPMVFRYVKALFLSLLLIVFICPPVKAERTITQEQLTDKMHGFWLGQLLGNMVGRATEGDFSSSAYPQGDPCSFRPWVIRLEGENWDADDDTDIEYIALHTLETDGFDCNSREIADQWREHITTSGIYIANRQAWYLMGDGYLPPETGSRSYNEHWYSIDSQITTELFGAISPGLPQAAIDFAGKFAGISNEGFPTHAAQFYAAMYADAFFEPNVVTLVTWGLNAIPTTSRTYQVISDVLGWYLEDANDGQLNWRASRQKLYDYYQGTNSFGRYYNWIESTVNTGATVLSILYGQGNFADTVQIGVLAGWDCDCNPATAGALIGIIDGNSVLPRANELDPNIVGDPNYSDAYNVIYRPFLPDDTITNIAGRITNIAMVNIERNGGFVDYNSPVTCYIPEPCSVVPLPERAEPNGPAGLVAEAIDAGITVTPSAAVEYHISSSDRRNLDAIMDGVTDNCHNGHRPYYSYLSSPSARPELDWYQLNFSDPVKFEQLSFYEGDLVWYGINTYYRDDNPRGGFFTDLTVEVLRDGSYITPANLQLSEALDQYKMYQQIDFSFSPTVGDAIRIIGPPGGSSSYTTIMELEAQGSLDTGLYIVSVEFDGSRTQQSKISDVTIKFSDDVTISPNDIQLYGTTNGSFDANQISFSYDDISASLSLEFDVDSNGVFGDLLGRDTYELNLDCSAITDPNGQTLLDDDSNPTDGFCIIEFHSLFGDADGSGRVDLGDIELMSQHWLSSPGDTGLDSDGDNYVDFADFAGLGENWRQFP
ncbi:ADP-ribosylglycohydrolase family protein [Planctomycetota bacterium]